MFLDSQRTDLRNICKAREVIGRVGIVDAELIRFLAGVRESDKRLLIWVIASIYPSILPISHIEEFISSTSIAYVIENGNLAEKKASALGNAAGREPAFVKTENHYAVALPEENLRRYSEDRIKRGYLQIHNGQVPLIVNPSKLISLMKLAILYPHGRNHPRIGLVSGSFDLIHLGHVRHINNARRLCDVLVVATMSTSSLRAQEKNAKGDRPIYSQADRITVLSALRSVDHVVVFDEPDCKEAIRALRPQIFFKNVKDMNRKVVKEECDLVRSFGGEVSVSYDSAGYSSTDLINHVRNCAKINSTSITKD